MKRLKGVLGSVIKLEVREGFGFKGTGLGSGKDVGKGGR